MGLQYMLKTLSTDATVSFLHLPVYLPDRIILNRLEEWGVKPISVIKKRVWPDSDIADGTRFLRVRFNNKVRSLPYSTKFDTGKGAEYFWVLLHNGQVPVCRLCIKPGHIYRECPDFKCFRCNEQGHYAQECRYGAERAERERREKESEKEDGEGEEENEEEEEVDVGEGDEAEGAKKRPHEEISSEDEGPVVEDISGASGIEEEAPDVGKSKKSARRGGGGAEGSSRSADVSSNEGKEQQSPVVEDISEASGMEEEMPNGEEGTMGPMVGGREVSARGEAGMRKGGPHRRVPG